MIEGIVWGQSSWWGIAALAWLGIAVMVLFAYRRGMMPMHLRVLAISLKLVGAAILLACLLEPMGTMQRPKSQANIFGLLVDSSRSMQVAIEGVDPLDREAFQKALAEEAEWQRKLANDFRVRRYAFDGAIQPVDTYARLEYRGNQSSLQSTLETLKQRYAGRPLAGVLLFSDGQSTEPDAANFDWKSLGFPVFPVRIGEMKNVRDLRISNISTKQSDFEASPVTMTASVTHNGFPKEKALVELLDSKSKIVQSQEVLLADDGPTLVEFRFRPEEPGVQGYRIEATLMSAERSPNPSSTTVPTSVSPSLKEEITLGNNVRYQVVDRGRGPYRILYVAGRPNWEHKFLRRALTADEEIQLASLVRIAKKEPKFSFRDIKIDSSNPLFSGFEDISEEEKEQYNQPVFTRMGITSSDQLKGGFPKDAEELFEYHAIILDDLEHDFFSQDQQSLLRQFVTMRGGGLLVLGGQESMRGTGFKNSVLSQLLPIYGEDAQVEGATAPMARYQLTREGWLQPFLRTADTELTQKDQIEKMPNFEVVNRTRDVKPGASILAEVALDEQTTVPALIAQRFGKGRTAALMIGDMWRWGMHHDGPGEAPLFQAWRQITRWLISDVPRKIEMRVERSAEGNRAMKILVQAQSSDFQSLDNAKVELTIQKPKGEPIKAICEASPDRPGLYESTMVADDEGIYTAVANVIAQDGTEQGSAHVGWVHEPSALEFQGLGENQDALKRIADSTGGEVIGLGDLESFVASLPSRRVPITETKIYPLWHQAWVLLLAVACLCAEWGLRRWHGMA